MTTDERRLQRAHILIDLEDAEEELGALRTKAHRIVEGLKRICSKIEQNVELEPGDLDFSPGYELKNRLAPEAQSDFVTYDEAVKLIEELKVARQKVVTLNRQKGMTKK